MLRFQLTRARVHHDLEATSIQHLIGSNLLTFSNFIGGTVRKTTIELMTHANSLSTSVDK